MASLSVQNMRESVMGVYPWIGWRHKVERMSDAQIIALYHKFVSIGKLCEAPDKPVTGPKRNVPKFDEYLGEQLSIDDIL